MEILGIVWAASIINPTSAVAKALEAGRKSPHQPILIEETASWFNSLASAYGWANPRPSAGAAHSSAGALTSWLVPDLQRLDFVPGGEERAGTEQPFRALVPTIGAALTSFEDSIAASATPDQPPEVDADLTVALGEGRAPGEWHSWNAVAAVRVEPNDTPTTGAAAQPDLDKACWQAAAAPYQDSPIALQASPKKQVWVHDHFIGDIAGQVAAEKIAQQLRMLIREGKLEPAQLSPLIGSNFVGIAHRNDVLFVVDETMRSHPEVPATAIAVQWINNLRLAFDEEPLGLASIQMAAQGLSETPDTLYGTASWYGPGFHGRKTANGEIFDENALTAAHKTLPFNTYLKVTNRLNGKSVIVRINDRGPYVGQRSLDLSKAAAHCLGSTQRGVIPYEAVMLKPVPKPALEDLTTISWAAEPATAQE
ncbi:MAG TPA: septal ring lytic transglycosylase RlpA family protein [Candidatus Obscuribacterales bacterium]